MSDEEYEKLAYETMVDVRGRFLVVQARSNIDGKTYGWEKGFPSAPTHGQVRYWRKKGAKILKMAIEDKVDPLLMIRATVNIVGRWIP